MCRGYKYRLSGAIQYPPVGDYPADFAGAYNDYAGDGVVPGATNTGGVKALSRAIGETTPDALGQASPTIGRPWR